MKVRNLFEIIFSSIAAFSCCNAFCQQDVNWIFGDHAGLKFETGEIIPFASSIYSVESSASISDSLGNLLFYSDGISIWNREHAMMENGDSLFYNALSYLENTSCTQGSLILPDLNFDDLYYVFSLAPFSYEPGLVYAKVDISANGGLGAVVSKGNLLIAPDLTEKLIGIKHGNGRDWWVIGHLLNSNNFYELKITPDGISGPFFQSIGTVHLYEDKFGEMESSLNGEKILVGLYDTVDVFSFDRCTGALLNLLTLQTPFPPTTRAYSCAFSESSHFAYIGTLGKWLYQINLNADDLEYGSWTLIYESTIGNSNVGQIQNGPDGKVYVSLYYSGLMDSVYESYNQNLSVINFPELNSLSCDFDTATIFLGGERSFAGLPNMPNYNLGALAGSECDTLGTAINNIIKENKITVYPNPVIDNLTLNSNNNSELSFTIQTIQGQIILSGKFVKQSTIYFNNYPAGIYLVEIKDEANKLLHFKKIVKV